MLTIFDWALLSLNLVVLGWLENEGLFDEKNPPKESIPPKGVNIRALLASVVWDSVAEDV
jgi:hypothetical protein